MHRCWNWGDSICVNLEVCLVSFFDLIVYIDLFSITIYTITAIAVEPAFSTHDRNVSTFKRVIVKDYIAGMVGTSSAYPFRRGFLRLAIKLRCPL